MPTDVTPEEYEPSPIIVSDHHVPGQAPELTALIYIASKLGAGAVEEVRRILAGGPEPDETMEDYGARVEKARRREWVKAHASSSPSSSSKSEPSE